MVRTKFIYLHSHQTTRSMIVEYRRSRLTSITIGYALYIVCYLCKYMTSTFIDSTKKLHKLKSKNIMLKDIFMTIDFD